MIKEPYIITVINSITETSMPWNEFVLARYNETPDVMQAVLVFCDSVPKSCIVPSPVKVVCVGKQGQRVVQAMRQIISDAKGLNCIPILHFHQPKSAAIFNMRTFFRFRKIKKIFTVHSLFSAYNAQNKLLSLVSVFFADNVTFVSRSSFERYPKFVTRMKGNRCCIVTNGVDTKRIDTILNNIDETRIKTGLKFVYTARMIPIKNHEMLLSAFSNLSEGDLYLIGEEDSKGHIREHINSLRLNDRVHILGLIPRDKVFQVLKDMDVYVSTSKVEGLPISLLEAMYVGLPVIASDIKPHLEIGLKCPLVKTIPLDEACWIETLNQYSEMSRESLVNMGNVCKSNTRDHFSLSVMLHTYMEIYISLIGGTLC